MEEKMKCELCNSEFEKTGRNQRYCSKRCRRTDFRKNNRDKINQYHREWHRKNNPLDLVNCLSCGKFLKQNNTKHIFCDQKCCNKFQRKANPEKDKLYHYGKYITNKEIILERQKLYNKKNKEEKRKLRYQYYLRNKQDLHKQERIKYHIGIYMPIKLVKQINNDFYIKNMERRIENGN